MLNRKQILFINTRADIIRNLLLRVFHKTYAENLNKKSGNLFRSIVVGVDVVLDPAGELLLRWRFSVGGGNAFYAAFQEWGTGIYATKRSEMKQPYYTTGKMGGKSSVEFNDERLKFPQAGGYLILKRNGGGFHSFGVRSTFWVMKARRRAAEEFKRQGERLFEGVMMRAG